MKPKQAKAICGYGNALENTVCSAFEFGLMDGMEYWLCLRRVIESIERAGFKVSITKDGKEYNR